MSPVLLHTVFNLAHRQAMTQLPQATF